MIDLKQYRIDPQMYQQGAANKGIILDWSHIDALDISLRNAKAQLDEVNAERNMLSKQIEQLKKSGQPAEESMEKVKLLKHRIEFLENECATCKTSFDALVAQIPNPSLPDVPVGKSDAENIVIATCGTKPTFTFTPKPHREILEAKGYLDQTRAVNLSGSRFVIVRDELALLELALIQRAVQTLVRKWFSFALVPQLVKESAMYTTGFLPNDSMNLYRVNPKSATPTQEWEEDDLWLIGTAEVPLVAQHAGETFTQQQLPLRYVGFSSCYRREAGTYGKDTKGLIRVHQFEKIEMVSFVLPEDSEKEHELLRETEEELLTLLGLPYQRLMICTGDLGAPAAKKYDLEAWFPGIDIYKEVTSTSNTTDFQTRRGNIKYQKGETKWFAHALNGTAIACGRILASIVENYQTEQGDIRVPAVLVPFMGKELI